VTFPAGPLEHLTRIASMPRRWKQIHIIFIQNFIFALLVGSLMAVTTKEPGVGSPIPSGGQPSTLNVREQPVDVDNYPIAPHGLELQQVHVFVRHGTSCFLLLRFSAGVLADTSSLQDTAPARLCSLNGLEQFNIRTLISL
jgi:hypothetical protein